MISTVQKVGFGVLRLGGGGGGMLEGYRFRIDELICVAAFPKDRVVVQFCSLLKVNKLMGPQKLS